MYQNDTKPVAFIRGKKHAGQNDRVCKSKTKMLRDSPITAKRRHFR
jgi:hypothetical protein